MKFSMLKILLIGSLICLSRPAFAQSQMIITFKDGSQILGKVLEFHDEVYTIESSSLGEIQIHESKIQSISTPGAANQPSSSLPENPGFQGLPGAGTGLPGGGDPALRSQVQQLQGQLMSDPSFMQDVQGLMSDPEMLAILQDPNLMNDIMSMDPAKLEGNPKIQRLLDNPEMKKLIERLQGKVSQ